MDPDIIVHHPCSCGNNRESKFKTYQNERRELLVAFCTVCGNEWLHKQFLGEASSENFVLLKHQQLYHRKRKEVSSSYCRVRDLTEIKLGDHIRWEEFQGKEQLFLEAIVVGLDAGDTLISVVMMQKQGFCELKIGRILINLSKITKIEIVDYKPSADPVELVTARAVAWCDEESAVYNLFTMKSKVFANYCKCGSGDKWKITWLVGSQFTQISMTVLGSSWRSGKEEDCQTIAEKGSTRTKIKTGIVIVANGAAIGFDMDDVIKEKQEDRDAENFINGYIERFGQVLTDCGCNINGALAHNIPGGGIDAITFPTIDVQISVFIASVLKGKIPRAPQNAFGTPAGRAFGKLIHKSLKRKDEAVDLKDIHPGDHIVLPGRVRHPRCHAIVVSVNNKTNKIKLIRNTFERGVVEEWVEVSSPVLRVTYPLGQAYPAETVIERARSKLGERRYLFARYNCKHFAVWCESKEQA